MQQHGLWIGASLTAALCAAVTIGLRADEPRVETPAYNTMTDAQETALGREVAAGLEKEMQLAFVDEPRVQAYVTRLVGRLAAESRRPQLAYSVKVVDTAAVNAFALPGGFLYVNRGLMEWAGSEAELAAVLAHEVAHVVGRHGSNSIARTRTVDTLFLEASRVLFGDDLPARLLKQVGGPVALLASMQFTRADELQADLLGFYNLQRAGWSPDGMVDLFRHLGQRSTGLDSLLSLASTHPAATDRERQIVREMSAFPPPPGLTRDSADFQAIQAELKQLPRPATPAR